MRTNNNNRRTNIVALILVMCLFSTSVVFGGTRADSSEAFSRTSAFQETDSIDELSHEMLPSYNNGEQAANIMRSNRYYYKTEKTGKAKSISKKVSKAEAKTVNGLTTALLGTVTSAVAALSGGAVVVGWDFVYSIASQFFKGGIKEGTYKGEVYKVTYYKVDSLTGKKHKVKDGVRTKLTNNGSTITKTRWEK